MQIQIKDLADIQIGYQHRDKAQPIGAYASGSHRIIQIKDLAHAEFRGGIGPRVSLNNLYWITPSGDADRYQVRQGDVLFLSRGQRAIAAPVLDSVEKTLASYYFYILRPDAERVTAEYLSWFINQPTAQSYLERRQLGSHIKMVPKASFEELEIIVPPVATQRAIVELERLRQNEERAMAHLADARRRLITGLALKAATKAASDRRNT